MAKGLILLGAVASVIGVFALVLFTALARRERRAFLKGATPRTRGVGALQGSWRVVGMVLVLVAILAVIAFLSWRSQGVTPIRHGPQALQTPGRCEERTGSIYVFFPRVECR